MSKRAISWVVDRTIATKLTTCFGLIIAVGLCGGWLTYRSLLNIEASDRSAIHSHEVLGTTRTVWIGILKQESDVRAYLLTGDRSFLDRAQASDKALKATLARIETLTAANPAQQARFGQLSGAIQLWQHEVFDGLAADAKTVSISAAFGADGSLNVILTHLREISSEEEKILDQRDETRSDAFAAAYRIGPAPARRRADARRAPRLRAASPARPADPAAHGGHAAARRGRHVDRHPQHAVEGGDRRDQPRARRVPEGRGRHRATCAASSRRCASAPPASAPA